MEPKFARSEDLSKNILVFVIFSLLGVILLVCNRPDSIMTVKAASFFKIQFGGPCKYKKYEVTLRILDINVQQNLIVYKIEKSTEPIPSEFYSRNFSQKVSKEKLDIIKQEVTKGHLFLPATLKLLIRGSCTPFIIDFSL